MAEENAQQEAPQAAQVTDLSQMSFLDVPAAGEAGGGEFGSAATARNSLLVPMLLVFNTLVVSFLVGLLVFFIAQPAPEGDVEFVLSGSEHADAAAATQPAPEQDEPAIVVPEGVSWADAEQAFDSQRYGEAIAIYQVLLQASLQAGGEPVVRDLFRLRTAQCLAAMDRKQQAREAMEAMSLSGSPIIRAVANYHLAAEDVAEERHLQARIRCYQALGALAALDRASPMEQHCDFLIARAMTQRVLALLGMGSAVTWDSVSSYDPFAGRQETELRGLLEEGQHHLRQPLLTPHVRKVQGNLADRWEVACRQATLEELLSRFATVTGMDIDWGEIAPAVRRRAVTLACARVSEHRLFEIACGMTGLTAAFTGDKVIIRDPVQATTMVGQRELLNVEAVSTWRRFFLRSQDEDCIALGHYAVAWLYRGEGDTLGAMREYQLVARSFPQSQQAPLSLLESARLRMTLRDFAGAGEDLRDLLDTYPNSKFLDSVYLDLGWATLEAGRHDEAIHNFSKLHYLNLSRQSQVGSLRGMAMSQHRKGDHEQAVRRFAEYLEMTSAEPSPQTIDALICFGRSLVAQGKQAEGAGAFYRAISLRPPRDVLLSTLNELCELQIARGNLVQALGLLNRMSMEELSEGETLTYLLLSARVFRAMGLADKAVITIRNRLAEIRDQTVKPLVVLELARCQVEAGDLSDAKSLYLEVLPALGAAVAQQATCELAELCLRTNQSEQAIMVLRELLKADIPRDIQTRASNLLGKAYLLERQYEKAAVALSGSPAGDKK